MDTELTFVWIYKDGQSEWKGEELAYSMRSVHKFHPNARYMVVGLRMPIWYNGPVIRCKDHPKSPYKSQWTKLLAACESEEVPDMFVYMDDDFILTSPLSLMHYKSVYNLEHKLNTLPDKRTLWGQVVKNTIHTVGLDAPNHMLHVPLPIYKGTFVKTALKYDWGSQYSLVPRQMYCMEETRFPVQAAYDVKTANPKSAAKASRFFSIHNAASYSPEWQDFLETTYPNRSPFERA